VPPAIDVHAHASPAIADLATMREVDAGAVPEIERDGAMVYFRYRDGTVNGPAPRGIVDVEHRLEDMERTGVAHQVISARPRFFTYDLAVEPAARLAALTNDSLVAMAATEPTALSVMISLPLQSTEASIAEVTRWAPNPLVRGVLVDSNIAGLDYADPELAPVWASLEAAGLPVLVHPYQADVVGRDRLQKHYLFNLIGNPADTTIAISNVVFGGLLDLYPSLKWGFVHGGGVAPYLMGRWDHGWRQRATTREKIEHTPPSELVRRLWFDCLVHDSQTLHFLADRVGWDRIMLGTDYPFDMGYQDPMGFIDSARLDAGRRAAVLNENPARFLRPRQS
jgi:aminocarboxymuconate-semialdehyde decarboxylase